MLCGVFQGRAVGEATGSAGSAVDAWRRGAILRRHWREVWGRVRRSVRDIRAVFILKEEEEFGRN